MPDYSRQRVFNYELDPAPESGRQLIQMHKHAQILGVVEKYGFPYILTAEDETEPFEARVFRTVTTGEYFNREILEYVGTLRIGGPVVEGKRQTWYTMHVFEVETALSAAKPDPIDPRWREDRTLVRNELAEENQDWPEDD